LTARQHEWQSKFEAADKLAAERQAEIEQINARLQTIQEQATARSAQLEAQKAAEELGNLRVANSVLLGALSAQLAVPEADWLAVIESRVPHKHVEVNRQAFFAGRKRSHSI